jgi:anti-anti-sigma factor
MDIVHDGPRLVLSGDFDVRSTMEVRAAIHDRLRGGEEDLVVDLTGVTAVDVTALKVLAAATVAAEREGRHLTLRGAGPAVRRMLHLSRLIRVVELERVAATA